VRKSAGLTLVEMLVVVVLSFLLLVMIHQLLTPLLGSSRATTISAYQSQQAHFFMERFTKDIKQSRGSGLSYLPETASSASVVTISKPERLSDEGLPIYEARLTVYRWSPLTEELELFHLEPGDPLWPPDFDPTRPARPDGAALRALAATDRPSRILASKVSDFEPFADWPVRGTVDASLTLKERAPGQNKFCEFSLRHQISLRQ
jgi:type II secretory pathway pseudopilin PulG